MNRSVDRGWLLLVLLPLTWGLGACSSHVIFAEESHFGLKARFSGATPSPVDVDLGYRRGVVAAIPQQNGERRNPKSPSCPPTDGTSRPNADDNMTIVVPSDPEELMSIYSTFRANIGFDDPIEVQHFLATGFAATQLTSSATALQGDLSNVGAFESTQPTESGNAGVENR